MAKFEGYKDIYVFVEQRNGEIANVGYELISEARKLVASIPQMGFQVVGVLLEGHGAGGHGNHRVPHSPVRIQTGGTSLGKKAGQVAENCGFGGGAVRPGTDSPGDGAAQLRRRPGGLMCPLRSPRWSMWASCSAPISWHSVGTRYA